MSWGVFLLKPVGGMLSVLIVGSAVLAMPAEAAGADERSAEAIRRTVPPMIAVRRCAEWPDVSAAHHRRVWAAIRVARVAEQRSNHAGFRVVCGRKLALFGAGKPGPRLVAVMDRARRQSGLKVEWRRVPHTRFRMKGEERRLARHPRIAWTEITRTGRLIRLGTSDEQLRTASKAHQRDVLGITVRHFRLRGLDIPSRS